MREAPAARAASVAVELLAFYREPVRHRTRYLHGEQALPDGGVVFRLALGRFPPGWMRDMPAVERDEVRIAARAFVRQVCLWERATHYQLLCVAEDAKRDAIRENYHLLIALIHPDRQEAASEEWPTGCSQRANLAYETLSDPARCRAYDASFANGNEHPVRDLPQAAIPRGRSRLPAAAVAKRFVVLAGVIATLFVVQAWWVSETSPQHAVLERSFRASSGGMRGLLPDVPRFIASGGGITIDAGERLEPLKEPRRLAALSSWIPVAEIPLRARADASPRPASTSAEPGIVPVQPPVPATLAPALRMAPAPVAMQPEPSVRLAQAPASTPVPSIAPARPAGAGPTRDEIEQMVASLVSYYDAGDAERLVGLIDSDALGFWRGFRVRGAYADFFGATRERRLRMERLTWQVNGLVAQARGEAMVVAEFQDGRARLERRVPVELDIVQRDGKARITRLVLYPAVD
jgi:hypothetical protein